MLVQLLFLQALAVPPSMCRRCTPLSIETCSSARRGLPEVHHAGHPHRVPRTAGERGGGDRPRPESDPCGPPAVPMSATLGMVAQNRLFSVDRRIFFLGVLNLGKADLFGMPCSTPLCGVPRNSVSGPRWSCFRTQMVNYWLLSYPKDPIFPHLL